MPRGARAAETEGSGAVVGGLRRPLASSMSMGELTAPGSRSKSVVVSEAGGSKSVDVLTTSEKLEVLTMAKESIRFEPVVLTAAQIDSLPEVEMDPGAADAKAAEREALEAFMARAGLAHQQERAASMANLPNARGVGGPRMRF